jgi:hypothetical protein
MAGGWPLLSDELLTTLCELTLGSSIAGVECGLVAVGEVKSKHERPYTEWPPRSEEDEVVDMEPVRGSN